MQQAVALAVTAAKALHVGRNVKIGFVAAHSGDLCTVTHQYVIKFPRRLVKQRIR